MSRKEESRVGGSCVFKRALMLQGVRFRSGVCFSSLTHLSLRSSPSFPRIFPSTATAFDISSVHSRQEYQYRCFSSFPRLLDIDNDLDAWPKGAINTLFNICPQGEHRVVERLGRFHTGNFVSLSSLYPQMIPHIFIISIPPLFFSFDP